MAPDLQEMLQMKTDNIAYNENLGEIVSLQERDEKISYIIIQGWRSIRMCDLFPWIRYYKKKTTGFNVSGSNLN